MSLPELDAALRKLRVSGMADVLEARLRQAQQERQAPIEILSALVGDELMRREDRLLARRLQHARFRDADRTLDTFDFGFNRKMPQALIHELATARFVAQREDALLLGPRGTEKVIWPRRSVGPRACRAIASSTARRTSCSKRSPRPPSRARARR
jgi:DNA replication protein DnaC